MNSYENMNFHHKNLGFCYYYVFQFENYLHFLLFFFYFSVFEDAPFNLMQTRIFMHLFSCDATNEAIIHELLSWIQYLGFYKFFKVIAAKNGFKLLKQIAGKT